jgi:exopolysaccharide biosynthesis polyprenyl glycosylphosphotransferase
MKVVEVERKADLKQEWDRFRIIFRFTYPKSYKVISVIQHRWRLFIKRAVDVVASLIGLILLLPLFLIIGIAIKFETPGPILFSQKRLGKGKKPFRIFKFRTMIDGAEKKTGPVWARKNDPRITKIGKILRQTHLDELPQLINVLKGNMSLVGPRPEREEFVEYLRKVIPNYDERFKIKPGITGLAQIRYKYDETIRDVRRKLKYDLIYVKNMCLRLDFRILFTTLIVVLKGRAVH